MIFINYFVLSFAIGLSVYVLPLELPVVSFEKVKEFCDSKTGIPQIWEDGKIHPIPQDYADMTGWKELVGLVAKAYNQLDDSEKKKCTIFAENYGEAGAIQFYGHIYGLPAPISFNDSYILWSPDSISKGPLIYVNNEIGGINGLFNSYSEIGRINNEYFRENGIAVFLLSDPGANWNEFYIRKAGIIKNDYSKHNTDKNLHAISLTGIIQAEDCHYSSGIKVEITSDNDGGLNIGWVDKGDWMEYKIDIPVAGKYIITYRIASLNGGGSIEFISNGIKHGITNIPVTGGWQKWKDATMVAKLNAGEQIIRLAVPSGGWNLNWWSISPINISGNI